MSAENKNPQTKAAAAKPPVDPQDEINEIMNEIESLQKSMAEPAPAVTAAKPPSAQAATSRSAPVAASAASAAAPKPAPAAAPITAAFSASNADPLVAELEADLAEFRGSSDDASMEETLGSMQAEPAANSLLDVAPENTGEATSETDDLKAQIESELQMVAPQSDVDSLIEAEMAAETSRAVEKKSAEDVSFDADQDLLQELEAITPKPPAKKAPQTQPLAAAPKQTEKYVPAPDHLADDLADLAPPSSPAEASFDSGASTDGLLTMSVAGSMQLKLKYEFSGQEVTLSFSDGALKISLADGTEFKVPVGRARNLRAA